jgi:AAA+ superfamily predicted ATPase
LRRAGLRPVALAAAAVPADATGQGRLARLCEREALLERIGWLADLDGADPAQRRTVLDMVGRIAAPVVVTAREPAEGSGLRAAVIGVGRASASEIRQSWQAALGAAAVPLAEWIDRVAGQFDLSIDAVHAVAAEVGCEVTGDPDAAGGRLWNACRSRARPELDGLAQRIVPRADWADVVLPESQRRTLRQIAAHLRHRLVVLHDWGFADRTSRGLGTAVLFAGPSGTGKTLAAEVIAGALGLDLYRVDLSQTVSKYIGETEKNLGRIFDAAEAGGGVLLFDEADALFGKRSEVKDSHDRYANIEVGYLLQRVEAFRGLAVLTTNMMDSLDAAVLRRLRFVVHFPFPDAEARQEIWRRALPARTPTEGLDPVALAQLSIPGGTIHSIALSAAFLAADAGEPVRMDHILAATRTEYRKQERPLTRAETIGWVTREPAGPGQRRQGV